MRKFQTIVSLVLFSGIFGLAHAPAGTFYASGANNNQCFVVPEWKMVVVRLGDQSFAEEPSWNKFFELLSYAIKSTK